MGNIITDTLLFFLLVLLIARASISKGERVRLSIFGLGGILIAVEIIRLVEGLPFTDMLLNRIVWGSIEVAIAASIATLPTIYVLLRLRLKGRPKKLRRTTKKDPVGSPVAADAMDEANHQAPSSQHAETWDSLAVWDGSASTEIDAHELAYKLMSLNSTRGSSIDPVSPDGDNRNSWPMCRPTFRHAFLTSRPCSRVSARMRALDDDHDDLSGWIELQGTDTRAIAGDASSPEPDDPDTRSGGIFVATEISQVYRVCDVAQRPRIVTIPRRAKVDRSLVRPGTD